MVPFEVCAEDHVSQRILVLVKHGPDFTHVCKPVVVFGT
jgi:hypothetical protein